MDDIDRIRAFGRAFTRNFNLLGRSYLGTGWGLTEARLLHDLDRPPPVRARELARDLGLDEAYVSRTLSRFEARGLVCRRVSAADARAREVELTAAGQAQVAALRAASRAAVQTRLGAMPPDRQAALAAALTEARHLIEGPSETPVLRGLEPGDAGWIVARHGALYAAAEGFDASFEALVAEIVAAFLRRHDPARERGWIAQADGRRLGSLFCMAEGAADPGVARLRLFLVEPEARGTGLAQTMLDSCLDFARQAGYREMRLWTHESHRAAGRLYARNGFALTDRRPARSFGVDVVEQRWQRPL